MQYKPYDYQKYATDFILTHPEAAILLECGLGKTVIALSAIWELMMDRFLVHRVLLIAPLRVCTATWPAEIAKWDHLEGLTYAVAVGNETERRNAIAADAMITIINRENVQWLIEKSGLPFKYDMVVIDELSSFKSHQSKRFRALMKVRPYIKRIVGLTGTPASNGLMDLWAQFRLLDRGARLGRYITHYRDEFFQPDRRNGMQIYSYRLKPGADEKIYHRISDITISMKSVDYLKMPRLISNTVPVVLSRDEHEVYEMMRKEMVLELKDQDIDAVNAASLTNKLCQMANGAVYDDDHCVHPFHNRKLDALEDLIEAANGKPVLVAYWFKHDRDRIMRWFKCREIKSMTDIADWNAGKIPVALIHPASAGHGLNLQAGGSTLIWFGLTWSLELYQQTNARLWRQGQTAETVVIHHIVTVDSIDMEIMEALRSKDRTQNRLIDAVKARLEV